MSARDEAVEMIRRICPPHLSADEYGRILAEKFDEHRTEVRGEVLREAAEVADSYTERFADMDAMKAAGIIGPNTMAGAIAEELRCVADGKDTPARGESTRLADIVAVEYWVHTRHEALTVRRGRPGRQRIGWSVTVGFHAWTPSGWLPTAVLSSAETYCWPDDTTALAQARTAPGPNGERETPGGGAS